mgnify:CR=1 FL=1
MNEISTANIKLIPLTKSQLFELTYATEKLEKNLALSISPTLLDDQTRQTVFIDKSGDLFIQIHKRLGCIQNQ